MGEIHGKINSISDFIDEILRHSCEVEASDIHIDPAYIDVDIKLRVAGSLRAYGTYDKTFHEEIVGRVKILSKLRTDIHDKSQDGRFFFEYKKEHKEAKERVDIRVSILPTFYGENIVLRMLRPDLRRSQKLIDLGLSEVQVRVIEEHISKDQGMIVIAGPTGSGKTTTIYTIVSTLSTSERNIVTIEDPIEYVIPGVRQIQVSDAVDFGFAKALRAILRQDPDIIILGEIRDRETAHLAFQASLTGHLVITTIHAEDSAGVYGRLHDLGVTREMMHSLSLLISQRLIKIKPNDVYLNQAHEPSVPSRRGFFEVIPVEGKTKVTLFQNTFPEYIRAALRKQGVLLLEDSIDAAYEGSISKSEKTLQLSASNILDPISSSDLNPNPNPTPKNE